METARNQKNLSRPMMVLLMAITVLILGCAQPNVAPISKNTTDPYQSRRWNSPVFTPAHDSFVDAARHFLSLRPDAKQPLEFPHNIHNADIGLDCDYCHSGVTKGAVAGIPSVNLCMGCHEQVVTDDPRITTLRDYAKRGEDLPWQRVYGFLPESHVHFKHASHIRAGVECATCHGDLNAMTVAQRVVDHTMGFCINCHKTKQASIDCLVCHY